MGAAVLCKRVKLQRFALKHPWRVLPGLEFNLTENHLGVQAEDGLQITSLFCHLLHCHLLKVKQARRSLFYGFQTPSELFTFVLESHRAAGLA